MLCAIIVSSSESCNQESGIDIMHSWPLVIAFPFQEAATGTSGRGAAASTSGLMPPPSATPAAAAAAHNKGNSGAAVEGDWRLKGPERDNTALPAFKPGTMTWDTEDYMADAKEAHKKKGASGQGAGKAGDGGGQNGGDGDADRRAGGGGASTSGRMNPMATYEAAGHVKYIESATTTGKRPTLHC